MKLSINSRTSWVLTKVSNFLTGQGVKAYLVGGFLRDVLLARETADIDIAVMADALDIAPEIAKNLGGKYVPLDKVNRMGRVVLVDETERQDFDFSTIENNIEQDLARRDFTIDAMAVDLEDIAHQLHFLVPSLAKERDKAPILSVLIDPFNGWNDLHQGIIRVVTEAAFQLDPLRLLRAVRLAGELGFSIDTETEALIQHYHHLLPDVAGERLREELLRILAVSQAEQLLKYLDNLGLLTAIFPELAPAKGNEQPKEHFWDVFEHSIQTSMAADFLLRRGNWKYASVEVLATVPWSEVLAHHFETEVSSGSTRRLMLKLAALLHDVAKPQTKAIGEDDRMHFLGHANEGATISANILERLRFSAKEIKLVELMVKHHLRPTQLSQAGFPSRRAIYRYFRDTEEAGIDTLFLSLADHLATRGPQLNLAQWQEHTQIVKYVLDQRLQEEILIAPPKLVNGHDLITIFGMSPGPGIGDLLEAVREAQAAGEVTTRQEALSYLRERLTTEAVNRYG